MVWLLLLLLLLVVIVASGCSLLLIVCSFIYFSAFLSLLVAFVFCCCCSSELCAFVASVAVGYFWMLSTGRLTCPPQLEILHFPTLPSNFHQTIASARESVIREAMHGAQRGECYNGCYAWMLRRLRPQVSQCSDGASKMISICHLSVARTADH